MLDVHMFMRHSPRRMLGSKDSPHLLHLHHPDGRTGSGSFFGGLCFFIFFSSRALAFSALFISALSLLAFFLRSTLSFMHSSINASAAGSRRLGASVAGSWRFSVSSWTRCCCCCCCFFTRRVFFASFVAPRRPASSLFLLTARLHSFLRSNSSSEGVCCSVGCSMV